MTYGHVVFMKNPTVSAVSSCSRMMMPGCFGPLSQLVRLPATHAPVVPPAASCQSSVLPRVREEGG